MAATADPCQHAGVRRFFAVLVLALGVLVAVLLFRAASLASLQIDAPPAPRAALDQTALASRLGAAIRLQTVSHLDAKDNEPERFRELHGLLERQFPALHRTLERESISDLSLLYRWPGSEPDLSPVLLAAHLDVVPVEPGTEKNWRHPPFSGAVADGFIWGRGSLDDKINVLAQLEAVASLLAEGFEPKRTLYLAFGHDEEVGGEKGAKAIAAHLAERGQRLAFVLDEGGAVSSGLVPGFDEPVAVVGVAEKGYVSFELIATASGGHSSMPPNEQSTVILSEAIIEVDSNRPATRLTPATRAMLDHFAPETGLAPRLLLANLWLFEPIFLRLATQNPSAAALVQTTTAPTLLKAGIKDNVVPASASATVNFRILPGETASDIEAHLQRVIDDPRVEIRRYARYREPSRESRMDGPAFDMLSGTIRSVYPGTIVVPYLVVGGTDARHYRDLSENVYRFSPFGLDAEDRARLHGTNERIAVDSYVEAVHFYRALIQKFNTLGREPSDSGT